MRYVAYVEQASEGCDYTIGCGRTLWWLRAQTYAEALRELKARTIGKPWSDGGGYEDGYWGEDRLSDIILFEVSEETTIPIDVWYDEAEERLERYKAAAREKTERMEFERLKRKYG